MLATVYDVVAGVRYTSKLVRRDGIEMVHARSHIPATIALALKKRFGIKMIFDLRGLMADDMWTPIIGARKCALSLNESNGTPSAGCLPMEW